jgi:PTS system mannitol-specific IIC component
MIKYLLPLLIGYTGGKMVGGDRGAVAGTVTTMGVIVGSDIPMFMGAMIAGPLGGLAITKFDQRVHGKIKPGFEMLVNNFSLGIISMVVALIAYAVIGPVVSTLPMHWRQVWAGLWTSLYCRLYPSLWNLQKFCF